MRKNNQPTIRAKKSLGQNFLIDQNIVLKIIETADIQPDDTVVEIGPGLGALTAELIKKAKQVLAIELDQQLYQKLLDVFADQKNLELIHLDALQYQPPESYQLIANIPYYITGKILRHFLLEVRNLPEQIVLLVQKEVAQRICAGPGEYSLPALLVQIFGQPQIIHRVSPHCFRPEPKVESVILQIIMHKQPLVSDPKTFFKLVAACFQQKRKKIHNTLSNYLNLDRQTTDDLLKEIEIDPNLRPQDLGIEQWKKILKRVIRSRKEN